MTEPSKEVARYADMAMFEAEPIDVQAGPQVHLLWMTPDPLGAIAAACKMYKGEVVRNIARDVTHAERLDYLEQITKTKLKAPFEFVKFHFLIEGVTRAFTHQLVRQRTAVYAQESLRFAVKEDMPTSLPPSLSGTTGQETPGAEDSTAEYQRNIWNSAMEVIQETYAHLVHSGMPAEDARGLLPHNVLTRVHYSTDLRALLDHAGNRLCTQAQFEWRIVFAKIAESIRNAKIRGGIDGTSVSAPSVDVFGRDRISDLFAPVCYQTGKCEFKANFDRHCSIRDRVDMFHENGVAPMEWGDREKFGMSAIDPSEWLLNPGAARKRA